MNLQKMNIVLPTIEAVRVSSIVEVYFQNQVQYRIEISRNI